MNIPVYQWPGGTAKPSEGRWAFAWFRNSYLRRHFRSESPEVDPFCTDPNYCFRKQSRKGPFERFASASWRSKASSPIVDIFLWFSRDSWKCLRKIASVCALRFLGPHRKRMQQLFDLGHGWMRRGCRSFLQSYRRSEQITLKQYFVYGNEWPYLTLWPQVALSFICTERSHLQCCILNFRLCTPSFASQWLLLPTRTSDTTNTIKYEAYMLVIVLV